MKQTILSIVILIQASTASLYGQNTLSSPVEVGTKSASFSYTNSQSTVNSGNNYTGRATNDVFYRFTLSVPMEVVISHCGSGLSDTYVYLLNASGSLIMPNDDYSGEGCCPNIRHSYIKRLLAAETYYVVSEGYSSNGTIITNITGTASASSPVDIGTKSASFTYTDTKNTANTGNNYTGRDPNDVLYKFTLSVPMEITATHCGSGLSDTYMHLLDASKNLIVSNDDYSGAGGCPSRYHSYIRQPLSAGTYYLVSEGYSGSGDILTTITGALPAIPVTGVSISATSLTLSGNETSQLTATVIPSNATNKAVTWTSSNTAVATVSSTGLVTAKAGGQASVTVTTADGGKTAACSVTVAVPTLSSNQNYIRTRTYTSENGAYYMDAVQYYDGLGRPSQAVQVGITPSQSDLVALQEYDAFGREDKTWLPVVASSNHGAFVTDFSSRSSATYNNTALNSAADAKPYACPVYEPSPLNRISEQYGPGASWHSGGKSVKTGYLTNSSVYPCALYSISGNSLVRNGDYDNNQLYVTKITDEEGSVSYEFKDKLDRVVLQRQMNWSDKYDTYYVYDDFGNLRYVLPSLAADATGGGSYDENSVAIKNYGYVYKYDDRNRCIWKKLPGCAPVYYVYDKADRLIFTQDGERRASGEWLFNKYDALGRVILSGIYADSRTHEQLREAFKNTLVVESFPGGNYGYTWNVQPIVNHDKVLAVNHYDDYRHLLDQSPYFNEVLSYEAKTGYGARYTHPSCAACSAKGLLVGTRSKITDGSGEIVTAMYYDEKGRLVQKKSTNHLGGVEKEFFAYDFAGQVTGKRHEHSAPGKVSQTETYVYEYDHAQRPVRIRYTLNSEPEIVMSRNEYDELGRLKTSIPYSQTACKTDYRYTIRSWVNTIINTWFTENLAYFGNGNVLSMEWLQSNVTRKYTFAYDELSRLRTANYNNPGSERFSVSYGYDKHGNITYLLRKGLKTSGSYSDIDILLMDYGGSNQLKYVHDYGETVMLNTSYDFKNYSTGTDEYSYNANGSMTKDLNRGISEMTYNVLNLPAKVDVKNPVAEARNEYSYSSAGQKLKVIHRWNPSYSTTPVIGSGVNTGSLTSSKTTDYVGNKIYENGALKRILTENGYYADGNYYFYVKNHLGSNVITANKNGSIVQSSHYYPFGLTMAISTDQGVQPYKYTGKELDMQHGLNLYDFTARTYDPAIGRFTTPDPLAEKYYPVSPYVYCLNNPVNVIDPDGRDIKLINVYKTNDVSGGYKAKIGVSATTQSTLKDFMKTTEGRNFFGQFAKAGDVVGEYIFEKNGVLSDKTLTLQDYSFEKGYNSNLPISIEGSINIQNSDVTVKVVSYGENKANVGEILTHETQLHGYKVEDKMKGKSTTTTEQDHKALKFQDKTHKGYQKYDSTRKQLETIDPAYKNAFKEADEHAKRNYNF